MHTRGEEVGCSPVVAGSDTAELFDAFKMRSTMFRSLLA